MEQIYYTQCPMGYGLGASNGFQIKRLTPGYPIGGDFRFLGLRAYLATSKSLSPPTLRYRRDAGAAEIAWLMPRPREYETERGLWGRPGGHFAHGIRLGEEEMAAIANWPAGLHDSPRWRRGDPEPTRDRTPEAWTLRPDDLTTSPDFATLAASVAREDVAVLARLLTAVAAVVREGRTLFLIDEAARLPGRVAFLTFAFPEVLRAELTFSTYHDRPEELPGFRLQGTVPAARPNRAALLGLGIVADLVDRAFVPRIEPSGWALTLAEWFVRGGKDDEVAWGRTSARARRARPPEPPGSAWDEGWLDHLFGFHAGCRAPASSPSDAAGWDRLAGLARWSEGAGLADEWLVRGPSWWREQVVASGHAEARSALIAHACLREAWAGSRAAAVAWGETIGPWLGSCEPPERHQAVGALLRSAPAPSRLPFLNALLRSLPEGASATTLEWLRRGNGLDSALLLPMEVRGAVSSALDDGRPAPLRDLLGRALAAPDSLVPVLDALATEAQARPGSRPRLAEALADSLEAADRAAVRLVREWALRGDGAEEWLAPHLRRLFATPDARESWRALRDGVAGELHTMLACASLAVLDDETMPGLAFRWAIEELLLAIDDARRPHDPTWPEAYLRRVSGLELVRRLFSKDRRHPGLGPWLAGAESRQELSPASLDRLGRARGFARSLAKGDAQGLLGRDLPDVTPEERGILLAQLLALLKVKVPDGLFLGLDACSRAWPGAFDAGAAGLSGLARPLAEALADLRHDPASWFENLRDLLGRLGLLGPGGRGSEPDSFAAEVVAATARRDDSPAVVWPLRQFLFRRDDAWRLLAIDARGELRASDGPHAAAVLGHWDRHLDKGRLAPRFYELMLNACDGPTLAALLADGRVFGHLRTIGPIPWWGHGRFPDASDDLRDAFGRLAPMAPLPEEALLPLRAWMTRNDRIQAPTEGPDLGSLDLGLLEGGEPTSSSASKPTMRPLSLIGEARWRCIEALTAFHRAGLDDTARWQSVASWESDGLPLERISTDDRHRFVAWAIRGLSMPEGAAVARLASWLYRVGVADADRVRGWADELSGLVAVAGSEKAPRAELVAELAREVRRLGLEARERGRKAGMRTSP